LKNKPKKDKTTRKYPIRVDLDIDDEKKFKTIQENNNLKNNAEVLRYCMNKVYNGLTLDLDDDISKDIMKLITGRNIKLKYGIINQEDFINRAITIFLEELKKERSLKNWNMRQELSQEENDTAVALVELQLNKVTGVTIDDLIEYLKTDERTIMTHLTKFLDEYLIEFREANEKTYYYAP
jgi:hypothetical protein